MKKIMVVLGSGGHTEQMVRLVDLLGKKFDYLYLICKDDSNSEKKIRIEGRIYKIQRAPVPYTSFFRKIIDSLKNIAQVLPICLKERPDAILSAGPGTAVFVSFIGKLLGSKIIYLESWSRVNTRSSSGKIIYRFADLFFVQWENLKEHYPKAVFAGRLA